MISTRLMFMVTILVACQLHSVLSADYDNHSDELECDHDTCYQPIVKGPCRGRFPRFAFNKWIGKCVSFTYSGCGGNSNNFGSIGACQQSCGDCEVYYGRNICNLPKAIGPCMAYIPRYWYNKISRRCEKFYFGGCGGNANNFETKAECNDACGHINHPL